MQAIEPMAVTAEWGRVAGSQLLLVAAHVRPACRLTALRTNIAAFKTLTEMLGLQTATGFDTIETRSVPGRASYGEWCIRAPATPHNAGRIHLYVAATIRAAERLRRADENGDDSAVGELLGYPRCCIAGFQTVLANRQHSSDPVLSRYGDEQPIDWRMNVSLMCFDYTVVPHVPCSPACRESKAIAEQYFDALARTSARLARELECVLQTWVLHSENFGVVAFLGALDDSAVSVQQVVLRESHSLLGSLVTEGGRVLAMPEHVVVAGCEFDRSKVRLFRYCDATANAT